MQSSKSPKEFAEGLKEEVHCFNGFNLVVADISSKSVVYLSNRPMGQDITIQEVSPGLHVLSNAELNSPRHKAQRHGLSFKEQINKYGKGEIPLKEMIQKLMRDTVKSEESLLPHICSLDWESSLSSIFVQVDTPLGG
ncbi:hypothetical protein L6164_006913 [Bauhinia variegata]|uniref:Uncharacterized protein n=1 Tax=Bauhinia variegata TaxID=167791 RepID=A0ACB9PXE1_BAUVA|nr:hypothetical protein L6164_006913 [Bauhinia variegata]